MRTPACGAALVACTPVEPPSKVSHADDGGTDGGTEGPTEGPADGRFWRGGCAWMVLACGVAPEGAVPAASLGAPALPSTTVLPAVGGAPAPTRVFPVELCERGITVGSSGRRSGPESLCRGGPLP